MPVASKLRVPAERMALIVLMILATPMAIPTTRKLLGNNSGFLRDLGFLSGSSATPLAWGLALAIAAGYIGFAVRNVPPVAKTWLKPSWSKIVVIVAATAAATVEEAVFRRIVMDSVMQRGGGWMAQLLASGLAFGLPHGIFGLLKRNAAAAVRAAGITGILGVLLGVAYLVGRRSLAPCITAHFLITVALEPGLLIAAVTNDWRFDGEPPRRDEFPAA